MANFRLPDPLDMEDNANLFENYKRWRRQVDVYMIASGSARKERRVRAAIIQQCAGPKLIDIFDQLDWSATDNKQDPDLILDKIEGYCTPRQSQILATHRFWSLTWTTGISFDVFLTDVRMKADSCAFVERDRMIRDKIVLSVTGALQENLLREVNLDLKTTIDTCRAFEQSKVQSQEINASATTQIDKVTYKPGQFQNPSRRRDTPPQPPEHLNDCRFCGLAHEWDRNKCPAWGKQCSFCNGRNHFQIKCRRKSGTHTVTSEEKTESDNQWLAVVSNTKERLTATMLVNGCDVQFQVDTGADVNTISQKYVRQNQCMPTKQKLFMWNQSTLQPLGEATLSVNNPKSGVTSSVNFTVVDNSLTCLLGLKTVTNLGLITVNEEKFLATVKGDTDITLGKLGEASLTVDPQIQSRTLPCRRIPVALQDEVRLELNRLTDRGILIPVDEPTKWVSQMAVVRKPSGKLRICIDPQPLNLALMREHYKLPTFDDVLPRLHDAKIFSKHDIREAFWSISLDEVSSKLTTMITPFGRFRWSRLPFGLKVSSEIFQKHLHYAIGDLPGVICVADDLVTIGRGATESEALVDHDQHLQQLMTRLQEYNVQLNQEKTVLRQKEITFLGHKVTATGIVPDEKKVQAILNMPEPEDEAAVRRFCGMVQYLARFIPHLSQDLAPLHALKSKGEWSQECSQAFSNVKKKLTEPPVLTYYNCNEELVVQVDSSKDGMGAVLLQDGKPIEYASRSFKPNEKNWAQIEKEACAVVYGLEKFDQYTFGRTVIVHNDHKPLANILSKPLSEAPKRLQSLMMRLFRYDAVFEFVPGKHLYIADTLSRAVVDTDEISRICSTVLGSADDIPDHQMAEVRSAITEDNTMLQLVSYISEGWPTQKQLVPSELKPYFDYKDQLIYEDGVIWKGERLLIPAALRADMKKRLHAAHLGYESMMRRARSTIFWPCMTKEVEQLANSCEACQELKPLNQRESLHQHNEGHTPWGKIGCDLFQVKNRHYLVTIDYYSNFIETDYLSTTTASAVIGILKKQFARFGIPCQLISDGGCQFSAQEFAQFAEKWKIDHKIVAPMHQQSNGKAEAAVKIVKNVIVKSMKDGTDPNIALLEQRNTPRQDTGVSPAQMMFGRQTRSILPAVTTRSKTQNNIIQCKRDARRDTVKKWYNKRSKDLPPVPEGTNIYLQHRENKAWVPGKVLQRLGDRDYKVQTYADKAVYRRNRVHIRPTQVNFV